MVLGLSIPAFFLDSCIRYYQPRKDSAGPKVLPLLSAKLLDEVVVRWTTWNTAWWIAMPTRGLG